MGKELVLGTLPHLEKYRGLDQEMVRLPLLGQGARAVEVPPQGHLPQVERWVRLVRLWN